MAKEINTRIMLKHDSLTNWNESSVVLKPGEVGVAYVDVTTKDAKGNIIHVPTALMKVGENVEGSTKTFKDLPFMSALAADVYSWAKEQSLYVEVVGEGEAVSNVEFKATEAHPHGAIVITKVDLVTPAELTEALKSYYTKTEVDTLFTGYYKKGEVDKLLTDLGVSGLGERIGAVENTIKGYGDIVTHNVAEFATAAQGTKADTAAATIATYGDIVTHNAEEFATVTNVNTELAKKADKTYVDEELDKKQDVIPENTYDAYGSAAAVEAKLADYTKTADMNAKFDLKADKSVVDAMYTNAKIDELIKAEEDRAKGIESGLRTDVDAIKGDYLKAADIANFETKENVKKVADDLAAYVESNDEALAEVKATAEAATTVEEVNAQIDTKITALNLGTTYEPAGAEDRAKAYVDQKFTEADLAQYTTEQEVKDIVDGVIANAADSETYNSLTKLVDYIDTHGGEAAEMAQAIETLEGDVKGLKEAPSAGIKASDIEAWNGEIGAKALAETKLDASTFTEYSNAHANDYTNKQIDDAIDADVKTAIEAEVSRADGKYEEKGVAATLDATLKAELEKKITDGDAATLEAAKTDASNKDAVVLAESQKYTDDEIAAAKTAISAEIDADVAVVQKVINDNRAIWDKAGTALQAADLADYAKTADVNTAIGNAIAGEVTRADGAYDEKGAAAAAQQAAINDAAGKYETKGTAQNIVDALKLSETYEPIGAETRAIAAAKTETENQIKALNIADYEKKANLKDLAYKDEITSDDFSDEVFVFNCGTSSTVL